MIIISDVPPRTDPFREQLFWEVSVRYYSASTRCHKRGDPKGSDLHTLQAYPVREQPKQHLIKTLGGDLSLPAVIKSMVQNKIAWHETVTFFEHVMSEKEAAKEIRERGSRSIDRIGPGA